ncbi:MAG: ABC transporter permease [Vicinamibacterales bacterium]
MRDLVSGLRMLRRSPGLAAAAILSIGLGIGATTAIFSVVRHVLLRPLPYAAPERLAVLWETSPDDPDRWIAPANYLDWQRDTGAVFDAMAAYDSFSAAVSGPGEPERLRVASASGSFFAVLGQPVQEGRALMPDDDRPGAPCVAVLTDALRRRRFGATPVLGSAIALDGRPCDIVGVLPAGFSFPLLPRAELWINGDRGIPRSFPFPGDITTVRDSHLLYAIARLRDGVGVDTASAALQTVMDRLAVEHPDTNTALGARAVPLHDAVVGDVRPVLWLLQATVGVLLLVACANVAHLLLGRATARQQEIAVRTALGAGRGRLVRQLLVEALAIALPGGVLGVLAAAWGVDLLVAAAPEGIPRLAEIGLDPAVVGFAAALTLVTTVLFGLAPALGLAGADAHPQLGPGQRLAGRPAARWGHRALVVGELALAQVLVVGALLLTASLMAATRVDLGFATDGRLAAELTLARDRYLRPAGGADDSTIDATPKRQFVDAVLGRLRSTPGVRAAAAAFTAPLSGAPNRGIRIEGAPEPARGQEPDADFQVVTGDFFRTLGITLLEGRVFSDADDARAQPVAIVNAAFARRHFAGKSPLGRVVRFGGDRRHVIVGVVADTRYRNVEQAPDPTFYLPIGQNDERWPFLAFVTWVDGDAAAAAPLLRQAVRAADPAQAISTIRSFDAIFAGALAPRRFNTWLVGLFGVTAMVLAALGAYGVMTAAVASRTRELGVRAALGASARHLRHLVLGETLALAAVACMVGLGLAAAGSGLVRALLYDVTPREPRLLAVAAGTVVVVAIASAWLPARRAARVNPIDALRVDG